MEVKLSDEELCNPRVALFDVFENNIRLPELRIDLKKIEVQILESYEKGTIAYDDMEWFFEKLDKVVQAAYLIHERNLQALIIKGNA
jgi:hypothetical protein